MKVDRIRLEL